MVETTNEDMMVALRNKVKSIIEDDPTLSGIRKVYKGTPPSIPNYPCVLLDWERKEIEHMHKGTSGRRYTCYMNVIVMYKLIDYEKRLDELLILTGKVEKVLISNRYLNGLRDSNNTWRVIDLMDVEVNYEDLLKPREFVLNSSEIKIIIKAEGS